MKNLLYKELRLALHPASIMFLALSAMLLIPSYPYYIAFFYTSLGVFFICMTGRENHDIEYSLTLPVRKKDIVTARIWLTVLLELAQFVLCVPCALIRRGFGMPNDVGTNANIWLFASAFVMMGLFNVVFFRSYYHNPDKVGRSFIYGSIVIFLYMVVAEIVVHVVPIVRDQLNTYNFEYLPLKLGTLAVGIVVFTVLTWLTHRSAVRSFEALDL